MKKFILSALIMVLSINTAYSGANFTGGLTHYINASSNINPSDSIACLPNSDVVILFDFNKFRGTKIFNSFSKDLSSQKDFKELEQKIAAYGINVSNIGSIAVGINVNQERPEDSKIGLIITGEFDKGKMLASIAANANKISIELEEYQGQTIYLLTDKQVNELAASSGVRNVKADEKIAVTFINSQTLSVGMVERVRDSIDVQKGKQQAVASSQQMGNYINSTNNAAILRFAFSVPDKQSPVSSSATTTKKPKSFTNEDIAGNSSGKPSGTGSQDSANPFGNTQKLLEAIQGVYGSVDFTEGFQLEVTALIRNESETKQISDALNGLLFLGRSGLQRDPKQASLAKLLNSIVVSGGTKDVRLNIDISEPLLNELIKAFSIKPKATKLN